MGWSLSLGRIFGTDVRVHVTFVLLIAWLGVAAWLRGGPAAAADAVAFIVAVFVCVLAHEFGHALMARRFGIATRDITLLPIGGVAGIERIPENPRQELLIALAGPAVNVVIATALLLLLGARIDAGGSAAAFGAQDLDLVSRLAVANVILVAFNLIPAFPMDGGRVLRALLSLRVDRARATAIAARVGQAIAFGLGFIGLFGNPILLFVALFVFLAASHESYAVALGEATRSATLGEATVTSFVSLASSADVGAAVDALLSTSQREFPVVDDAERLHGVLTRDGMIRALAEKGPRTPVVEVMERDVPIVNRRAPLALAVSKLQESGKPLIGIVDDRDRVVGLVTLENLAEYMMIRDARRSHRASAT
ncbi:MAG: site-2 protease family protein [Alphaproteobacteria bacterium]|nr:site-2 protease family protein [Alphaproteobacteria bacterium]